MENKRQNNVDSISVLSSYLILNNYFNVFYSQFCHLKNGAINSSVIALKIMITWIYSAHNTQYFINLIIYTRLFQKILWYFMEVFPVLVSFPHKAALRARNWVQKAYLGSNTRSSSETVKKDRKGEQSIKIASMNRKIHCGISLAGKPPKDHVEHISESSAER